MQEPSSFRKADIPFRRKLIWMLVALSLFGGVVLFSAILSIKEAEQQLNTDRSAAIHQLVRTVRFTTGMGSLVFTPAGFYFLILGRKTLREGIYPPHSVRVLKKTPVRTGANAQITGWIFIMGGIMLVVLVNFLFLFVPGALERAALP